MSETTANVCITLSLPLPSVPRASLYTRGNLQRVAPSRRVFVAGTPLVIKRRPSCLTSPACKAATVTIRCEQNTQEGNSVDVWLGRFAMVGFATAISVEIATGKGLLENFGLTSPLPTVASAVTGLVGVLAAVFIFQSASKK